MNRIPFSLAVLMGLSMSAGMSFNPPTPRERMQAISSTQDLPETLKKAFDPGSEFELIPIPSPGDWLAVHKEPGQTFDDFVRSKPNPPDKARTKIYLQPLGGFPKYQTASVTRLKEYATDYFAMEVALLPPLVLGEGTLTTRMNPFTLNRQILTGDVLSILKDKLPADAFCVLAITMEDLYPAPSWNFVFGQASLRERVGVYSFARYDPAFYGEKRGTDYEKILLRRSYRVLVHETAHMFGLTHCIYFRCVMNGSNHLDESDSRPLHLCPVCLRKLQYSIGFDVSDRYRNLMHSYQEVDFGDEARWVAGRLERIVGSTGYCHSALAD